MSVRMTVGTFAVGVTKSASDCRHRPRWYVYISDNVGTQDEDDVVQLTLPAVWILGPHLYCRSKKGSLTEPFKEYKKEQGGH